MEEKEKERMDLFLCPTLYILAWSMRVSSEISETD